MVLIKKREFTSMQLVETAFELFVEHGIEKTSLGMIAKKAGMTKPSIYYHFDTKDDLVSHTFDFIFKDHHFNSYFQPEALDPANYAQRLYQGGLNMLPEQDKSAYAVLRVLNEFSTLAERDEHYRARLNAMQQNFIQGFHAVLAAGAEYGAVSPDHLMNKAHLLALVIDNLSRCLLMKLDMDYHGVWEQAINGVLNNEFKIRKELL